uniref:Mariner Mos1 transposase n=1 Tax=Acrobeloides nanus TaxID=290746 RepID=A0A914D001_9BILA
MLCVWWDMNGMIYWELLGSKSTLATAVYSQQLDRVAEATAYDKIDQSFKSWVVLPHPVYNPDLASSDYHLFQDLQLELDEQHLEKDEDVKNWLKNYFDQKPRIFFERGIRSLPTKWAQVMYNNGEYFE